MAAKSCSDTMEMPISSNDVVHRERVLTLAQWEVGVPVLLMVPGSRRSEFVPLPYISCLLSSRCCQTSYFYTASRLQGENPVPFAQCTLWLVVWRWQSSSWADLLVLLGTEIVKKNPALGIFLTVLSWFARWKDCFSFAWGLGKKGLRKLSIFRAVLNRRSCKIPISEIYITCIARL